MARPNQTIRFGQGDSRQSVPRANNSHRALPAGDRSISKRSERYAFAHHPDSWSFHAATETTPARFLPRISTIQPKPGVQGVGFNRDPSKRRSAMESDGFTMIDEGDRRLGDYQYYNFEWPVQGGGRCYAFVGETPVVRGNRIIWRPSTQWDDFRAVVAESGIVEPIQEFVIEEMIVSKRKTAQRVGELVVQGKRRESDLEQIEEEIRQMEEILEIVLDGGDPIGPTPAVPKAKKAAAKADK